MKRLSPANKTKAYSLMQEFYLLSKRRYELENQTRSLTDAEYKEFVETVNFIAGNINKLRPQIDAIIF